MTPVADSFVFPPALISRPDLARLLRELEALDNELESQKARKLGASGNYRLPPLSKVLADMLEANKVNVSDDHQRQALKEQLRKLKDHAPVMHMTFATETDPASLQEITAWIRRELHPHALISVGLQPALIAGVYLRTPNHVHDFSLRSRMKDARGIIVESLDRLSGSPQ